MARFPFAWYTASAAAGKSEANTALSGLAVKGNAQTLGGVKFIVVPHASAPTTLSITNRTGRTYYRVGDKYTEILDSDTGSTVGNNLKQGSTTFDVKIVDVTDNTKSPSVESLASIAGTFTVTVTAAGSAKLDINQTKELGTDAETPVYNFGDTGATKCGGALGAAKNASVEIMEITISSTGSVSYKNAKRDGNGVATISSNHTVWEDDATPVANADLKTAWQSSVVYYGLEVKSNAAEADAAQSIDAASLTPDVAEIE